MTKIRSIELPPNREVIDFMREMLKRAEEGEMQGVLMFAQMKDSQVIEGIAGLVRDNLPQLVGHMELWLLRLKAEHLWKLEELRDYHEEY